MRSAVSSARNPSSPVTWGGVPRTIDSEERLDFRASDAVALVIAALFDRDLAGCRADRLAHDRQDLLLQVDQTRTHRPGSSRSLRSCFMLTRLAVVLATQPFV